MKKCVSFIISTIIISVNLVGQVDNGIEFYRSMYPDDDAVSISITKDLAVSIKNNKPVIAENCKEESILLSNRSGALSTNQVGHSYFVKLLESEAFTLVPDNNKYKRMDVKEIEDYRESSSGIFYDDSKFKKFIFPGLIEGAKTVFNYTLEYNEPWLWGSYFFTNGSTPVEDMVIRLVVPDKVKIVWKVIGDDVSVIRFSQTKKGKKTIYQWKAQKLPKLKIEDDGPAIKSYIPTLMLGISEYVDENGKTVKMMDGHQNLYAWYRKMVNNCKNEVLPEMQFIVDSLINNDDTEKDKVEKIYCWSQRNISYIAFEDGYSSFTPANSQDVFTKRYGDCKGKANLLKEMLSLAKITSYLTWVGTTHLPYKRDDIPGKPVDNHMIVTYIGQDGTFYFLDPTDDFISMDFPTTFIQGKEVMIGYNDTAFNIMKIPEVDKSKSNLIHFMNLKVDNHKLTGNGFIDLYGYNQYTIGGIFRKLSYDKQKTFFTDFFSKGNNKFILDTLIIENIDSPDSNGYIAYKYSIPNYVISMNDKIFINLNIDKIPYYKSAKYEGRQCGIFWKYKEHLFFKYVLDIPEGYEIESVPSDTFVETPDFGIKIKYTKNNNQIVLEKELYNNFILLDLSKIPLWNSTIKTLDKAGNQSIVLKKSKSIK